MTDGKNDSHSSSMDFLKLLALVVGSVAFAGVMMKALQAWF